MKLSFILLFCGLTSILNAQNKNNIDFISFKYNNSIVVHSEVKITIFGSHSKKDSYDLEVKYYEDAKKRQKKIVLVEMILIRLSNIFIK